ncbi:MAG: endonuclease III [Planctomycetota bacterium]
MPRESKADKKQRTRTIIRKLRGRYPHARTALNFSNPLELLVATILAAQCTDRKVNEVAAELFKKYRTPEDWARVPLDRLEQEVRPTGFYRNKARSIRNACAVIAKQHDGKVPDSMEELVKLPGVGRKTAAVVLGNAFGINEGIPVDTHVDRVSRRLKLTCRKKGQTDRIEQDLMELVPPKTWTALAHMLTWHGRQTCTARKPDCDECILNDVCPSAFKA